MCSKHSNNVLAVCVALLVLAAGAAPGQEAESAPVPAAVVEAPDVVVLPDGDLEAAPDVDLAPDLETVDPETLPPAGAGVSEAEEYFRRGVTLYKEGLYREALTEFNRALALEPDLAEALTYREKASARLQLTATGEDLTTVPNFEVFDEEAFAPGTQPALSPQELQRARVRELMEMAARYMEYQRWATAVEIYNEVLLIDPKNEAARDGLHQATIGVGQKSIEESQRELAEDRQRIREETEKKKLLPAGAGPDGIKPIRVQLPTIEEQYEQEVELSEIEKTLQSPVSIEFEDIHISEIVEFISDSYDVNIVIDNRVVAPPPQVLAAAQPTPGTFPGQPGVPGAVPGAFPPGRPGVPGAPGARPGVPGAFPNANNPNLNRPGFNQPGQNEQLYGQFRTDGNVPYINLTGVTLEEALRALLRPLGLDFAVQPGFVWISTPQIIREESFEKMETRFYELRNAGQQTLYKIVLRNAFGVVGGGGGGFGGGGRGGFGGGGFGGQGGFGGGGFGGQGGFGGGGFGGNQGGFGGGGFGNQGGFGGGGFGGYQGGFGGGGFGGQGGFGGGFGGNQGGFGGGGFGGGFGGGGFGGGGRGGFGGGGGADVTTVSNISSLFSSINDEMVGEPPANPGLLALQQSGTGADRGAAGGTLGTTGGAGLGTATGEALDAESSGSPIIALLSRLVPDVYEPFSGDRLSEMIYNPATNMLIVKNTPSNLDVLEKQLAELDVTPRQVSIEAKFLTIRVNDLDKIGFEWDLNLSDQNNRTREIESISQSETYEYDINGDGVLEEVPFYRRPDGTQVIRNTITEGLISGLVNPGPAESTFEFVGNILQNEDGDSIGVTFDFLDTLNESELLSAPRVTTMNLKPAVIADLQTEYFITQIQNQVFTTEGGFGGTPVQSIVQNVQPTPFNFGISLSVTPQISDNDQVRLWLNPEVRTRIGEKTFTTRSISGDNELESELVFPTTNLQAVWTNVIVHDGDTLVLGGLVQDQSARGQNKMPYVADIPLLGFFFRGKSSEVRQSSLLIFVTPQVIDTTGAKFFEAGTA